MHFYASSVICSSLSALCSASDGSNSRWSLVPSYLTPRERVPSAPRTHVAGDLRIRSPSRSRYTPGSPLSLLCPPLSEHMGWVMEIVFMGAVGQKVLPLSASLHGHGQGWGKQRALEKNVAWCWGIAMCLNRIMMKAASQPKMWCFKRRWFIEALLRFGNPASQGKLVASGFLCPSALLKCIILP